MGKAVKETTTKEKQELKPGPLRRAARSDEGHIVGWHVLNAVKQVRQNSKYAEVVFEWLGENHSDLELALPEEISVYLNACNDKHGRPDGRLLEDAAGAAIRVLEPYTEKPSTSASTVFRNVKMLAKDFGLSGLEADLICLIVHCHLMSPLDNLADKLGKKLMNPSRVTGCLLGVNHNDATGLLIPSGSLIQSGMISIEPDQGYYTNSLQMPENLKRILARPARTIVELRDAILGKACRPSLAWRDFSHIAYDRDYMARILSGALRERATGVNILLYGPPGTGKTELAKSLGKSVRSSLYSIAETDEAKNEPTRRERLSQVRLAQRFLKNGRRSVLLFDEMEDLLNRRGSDGRDLGTSKVFLNRLLEDNEIPTIWTTNSTAGFDSAMLRRFTAVLEIPVPGVLVRERIWKRLLRNLGARVKDCEIKRLAEELRASPGTIAKAVEATRLAGGGVADVRYAVNGMIKAMNGGRPLPPVRSDEGFSSNLINVNIDLVDLVGKLSSQGNDRSFSLCIHGPPGSGKSMFARHLARQLDMEVLEKRASDLLSMWVGGTEQNIAQAFEEARSQGAFLIFDEADSLLSDRRTARASWEVSQVNEMLTWMENHELPFACTTNLPEKLDQASLRRFTFKLRFEFLESSQILKAFSHFFGGSAPPNLLRLENLTVADFAVVKRRAGFTGEMSDLDAIVDLLRAESQAKDTHTRPIGFETCK